MQEKYRIHPDADTTRFPRKFTDVPYGTQSVQQQLDIYLPNTGSAPYPVVIFIHGGAWRVGDKADLQLTPYLYFPENGYALVSLNYRMSDEICFPGGFEDCKAAIAYLIRHGSDYQLDVTRMALAGLSAGANYVLLLLGAGAPVRCALSWYAITDIVHMNEQMRQNTANGVCGIDPNPFLMQHFGQPPAEVSPAFLRLASPIYQIPATLPPTLFQHGLCDGTVPFQQSVTYCEKAQRIAGADSVCLELFEGADHADAAFETAENMQHILNYFDRYLK